MTPARLAYFSECVRRHTNIVPSLAAEALAHIQEQAVVVERLRGQLAKQWHAPGCTAAPDENGVEVAACNCAAGTVLREENRRLRGALARSVSLLHEGWRLIDGEHGHWMEEVYHFIRNGVCAEHFSALSTPTDRSAG